MSSGTPVVPSLAGRTIPAASMADRPIKIDVAHLNFYYGDKRALHDISIQLRANVVSACA